MFVDPLMLRPASVHPGDMLADAAYPLLLEGGARALSLRGMARQLRTSVGSLADWAPPRHEAFQLLAARLGGRWEQFVTGRLYREGLAAFLPTADEEELDACRVWLAAEELGRAFPLVAFEVAEAHARERNLLAAEGARDTIALHALLRGLRVAIVDRGQPLDPDRALRIWLDIVRPGTAATSQEQDQAS